MVVSSCSWDGTRDIYIAKHPWGEGMVPTSQPVCPADMYPAGMPEPDKVIVTWEDLERLVAGLAEQLTAEPSPDVVLAISRGGLVPAGMLGYRLGWRDMLLAAVVVYDDEHGFRGHAEFLQFPPDVLLRGKRVVIIDEVWDSGTTIAAVSERVRAAGGYPVTAVLHYKPARSRVELVPDHFVVETDAWVVYPFKAGK
jgi:hypoxanthine phosphoribosyltransferase